MKRPTKPKAKRAEHYYPDIPKKRAKRKSSKSVSFGVKPKKIVRTFAFDEPKPRKSTRSATTGRWAKKADALADPGGTVTETFPPSLAPILPLLHEAEIALTTAYLPPEERINWARRCLKAVRKFVVG